MSFYLKGTLKESRKFLQALKVFTLAESLGGFESLAELPLVFSQKSNDFNNIDKIHEKLITFCCEIYRSVMTHASVPEEQRKILNISDSLIRISVGLEDAEDLIADLDAALTAAFK